MFGTFIGADLAGSSLLDDIEDGRGGAVRLAGPTESAERATVSLLAGRVFAFLRGSSTLGEIAWDWVADIASGSEFVSVA